MGNEDIIKQAEKNCVNIAMHMKDMLDVVEALHRFGTKFFTHINDMEGREFSEGVHKIRNAIYARFTRAIANCFVFVGVGGKEAEEYSKQQFKELFGDKQKIIMHLLDKYGNCPSWYEVDKEKAFRKQAMDKLAEKEMSEEED